MTTSQPRIEAVTALPGMILEIHWRAGRMTRASLGGLVRASQGLAALADEKLFKRAKVIDWGLAVGWPGGIDLSARMLDRLAREQAGDYMPASAFLAWRRSEGLTQRGAAAALGLSPRMIKYYESGEKPVPKTVKLACRGFSGGVAARRKRARRAA